MFIKLSATGRSEFIVTFYNFGPDSEIACYIQFFFIFFLTPLSTQIEAANLTLILYISKRTN